MIDHVLRDEADGIVTLTLNRPASRNALTLEMYDALAAACRGISGKAGVRALIIRGAGDRAFAAGTEMSEFRSFSAPEDAIAYERRMEAVFRDIERCAVPTIAAMTGACTGGGAAIAAACDLRLADARLKFGFPIARTLGNCLSVSNLARLSAIAGAGRVREMIFTARLLGAEEAHAAGIVCEVLPDAEALHARARALAAEVGAHAPLTLRATKEALRRLREDGPGAEDGDLVTLCYMSEDFREGLEAFLSKRAPSWKGR